MWRSARIRAIKYGVPFTITPGDILAAFPADGRCPVLGIPLAAGLGLGQGPSDASPSLDRVSPEEGYVLGNIAVISHRANVIKSKGTAAEHRRIAWWMEHHEMMRANGLA